MRLSLAVPGGTAMRRVRDELIRTEDELLATRKELGKTADMLMIRSARSRENERS